MATRKITTLQQLKELAADEVGVEVFILLNGGLRSTKRIWYFPGEENVREELWDIYNEIDDSYDEHVTTKWLQTETMIMEALEKGALFQYD